MKGKIIFKLLKSNKFETHDIARMLGISEDDVINEFNAWCNGRFVYPGIYVVGDQSSEILSMIRSKGKVLVIGKHGAGKTTNAKHACRKHGKYEQVYSLEKLAKLALVGYDKLVFFDDIDCYDVSRAREICKVMDKRFKIVITSTRKIKLPGFFTFNVRPPRSRDFEKLVKSKGWVVPKGMKNLASISKHNELGGGVRMMEAGDAILDNVKKLINGKNIETASKPVIDQLYRNCCEINMLDTAKIVKLFKSAWKSFYAGADPAEILNLIPYMKGMGGIIYRKSII